MLFWGILLLLIGGPVTIFLIADIINIFNMGAQNLYAWDYAFFFILLNILMLIGGVLLIVKYYKKKKEKRIKEETTQKELDELKEKAIELKILKENEILNKKPKFCTYCGGKLNGDSCSACGAKAQKEN